MKTLIVLTIVSSFLILSATHQVNAIPVTSSQNFIGNDLVPPAMNLNSPLKQLKSGIVAEDVVCKEGLTLVIKARDGSPACVKPESISKLVDRGWAISIQEKSEQRTVNSKPETLPLQVKVVGEKQVRRGTTHSIEIYVVRGNIPIEGARVFIDIEDYGKNVIKEFDGYTNSDGYFVFSWEIPQSFDDIETLLAFIDVTDGVSSKTELFKFQVYCLPGEQNCKVEGNR